MRVPSFIRSRLAASAVISAALVIVTIALATTVGAQSAGQAKECDDTRYGYGYRGVRPGFGYGDCNNDHSGPPGQSDENIRPGNGYGDKNHEHSGPPGLKGDAAAEDDTEGEQEDLDDQDNEEADDVDAEGGSQAVVQPTPSAPTGGGQSPVVAPSPASGQNSERPKNNTPASTAPGPSAGQPAGTPIVDAPKVRPGNGYGDENHEHSGPPGLSKDKASKTKGKGREKD